MNRFLSTLGSGLVALAIASNASPLLELNEIQTLSHLAAFESQQDDHNPQGHHHDDEDQPQSGLHTHTHRHAPEAPEHEHTHWDSAFFFPVATAPNLSAQLIKFSVPPISRTSCFTKSEQAPIPAHLTPLFRPPIV